ALLRELHWRQRMILRRALFFFFQAEDGIRDWSVTGVQTCALPISRDSGHGYGFASFEVDPTGVPGGWTTMTVRSHRVLDQQNPRSEERRVGKEGRSRWGPDR